MRNINEITRDILREWNKPYYGAVPYLQALTTCRTSNDAYGHDTARSLINYALANMSTFRGTRAKELKAELKKHLS